MLREYPTLKIWIWTGYEKEKMEEEIKKAKETNRLFI